ARVLISAKMDKDALILWQYVYENVPNWIEITVKDDCNDEVKPSSCSEGDKLNITLKCIAFENNRYIFTLEGWNVFLHNDDLVSITNKVNILGLKHGFETLGYSVEPWNHAPEKIEPNETVRTSINLQSYVKFYSSEFMPASDIAPWVLYKMPEAEDNFFKKWLQVSCNMLCRTLVNELLADEKKSICLTGKPPKKLIYGDPDILLSDYSVLQTVINWIFIEGNEIELKHTFFTSELAREWPEYLSFCEGLPKKLPMAFESAKLLYKAHIRASSRETIKSLSDLRKTLAEDTQKIISQSKDITSALWKDLALVISLFAIKYALDASKINITNNIFPYMFFALSIYIFISQVTTLFINKNYFKILDNTRLVWRDKLYGFLDDTDYENLAVTPLREAYKAYQIIATFVVILTLLISFIMIILGFSMLDEHATNAITSWLSSHLINSYCS
ncbi:hypothetical protein ACEZED_20775, partial [Escherichia coli]|uniref:hypothetical protein n=1 Tax=Escherichia coli TaxID=562 RepID=UPI0035A8B9F1